MLPPQRALIGGRRISDRAKDRSTFDWATQLKAAFTSVSSWIGILLAAVAVFTWFARTMRISLGEVFSRIRSAYEALFYPIADFVTGWTGLDLTPTQKDLLLLYMLLAGAFALTLFVIITGFNKATSKTANTSALDTIAHYLCHRPIQQTAVIAAAGLAWPLLVPVFLATPVLLRSSDFAMLWSWAGIASYNKADPQTSWAGWAFIDLRAVFVLQTVAIAAVVTGLALCNAAGVG